MRFWVASLFVFGFVQGLHAGESLNWRACVDEAGRNNAELHSAQENLRASQYAVSGAYNPFYPHVTGDLGYSRENLGGVSTTILPPGSSTSDSTNVYNATISGSEVIFNGFQDQARVDQAKANVRTSEATLESTRAKISFDLKSAYASLGYAQSAVKLEDDITHRREENLRLVQLRFESGKENKGSALLSKAYLDQAHYDALQARNGIAVAQVGLARVLGRDTEFPVTVEDEVPVMIPPESPQFSNLMADTPDHRRAVASEESARAGLKLSRGGFYPTINVAGSYGRQGTDWFPDEDRWSIGADLSVPLFSGGKDYYATKSSSANLLAASLTRANTDRQVLAGLKQAYASYVESVEKLKVDESFLEATQTRAEITRIRYKNGLVTFDDWDIIENDLINRQKTVLQTRRDRVISEAAWEQAQGKGILR